MIYVHPDNNPGNLEYTHKIFMFVKSWFVPVEEGVVPNDTWYAVPAIKSQGLAGQTIYTPININIESVSLMIVDEEGKVIKASRVAPGRELPESNLESIKREVFDISDWERGTGQAWPYRKMFDSKLITARYQSKYGTDQTPFQAIMSDTNNAYNNARASVMARPCNCGKPQYSG